MPKKIDHVVHVCSIVAMKAKDKGCYLQETCNKAPESYQQKTRHENPGDVVTGHLPMLGDVPLLSSSCLASLVLMVCSYGLVYQRLSQEVLGKSGSSFSIVEISIPTASFRAKSLEALDGLSKILDKEIGEFIQEQETFPGIMASFNQFGFNTPRLCPTYSSIKLL